MWNKPRCRVLLIANSVYQLQTAIHIKRSLLSDREADLLITDVTPGLLECAPRAAETGLFDRVLTGAVREVNQRYHPNKPDELSEAFSQISAIFGWALSDELDAYSDIYFANFDLFTRMLACRFHPMPCSFIGYEDGFSTYVIHYLRPDRAAVNRHPEGRKIQDKLTGFLLYEPSLAMRGDGLPNRPIPKISRDDQELRELLNYVFAYQKPPESAPFIFLEQSFRAEKLKTNDLELMRECQQTVGPSRFIVKPHPRNPENLPLQLGLTRSYPGDAPWELFLLNEEPMRHTVLTVCSNGALTSQIVLGLDTPTVMLYDLFEGQVLWQEDAVLRRYLRQFHRQLAGSRYYVPQTVYELRNVLTFLGGGHESSH